MIFSGVFDLRVHFVMVATLSLQVRQFCPLSSGGVQVVVRYIHRFSMGFPWVFHGFSSFDSLRLRGVSAGPRNRPWQRSNQALMAIFAGRWSNGKGW